MNWETFDKRRSRASDMTVSVFKTKKLSLSEAVVKALGTDYVELLYDKKAHFMALKPSTKDSPVSYKVRKSSRQRSWGLSLISFINYYELDDIVQKRFSAKYADGLIVIDLNEPINK